MSKPPFLSLITGRDGLRIKRFKPIAKPWYHLVRDGDKFPLAGGDMAHMMRTYRGL